MSLVNREAILNSNPKKKLIIGFEKLKENFNGAMALEYSSLYDHQPLSFILENSEKIFSEPYYGYDFYKNIVDGPVEFGIFHEYKNERDKVKDYLESHKDEMGEEQVSMYESLISSLNKKIDDNKNIIMVAEYTMSQHDDNDIIISMLDNIYESMLDDITEERLAELDTNITEAVDAFKDDKRYFIYGPLICSSSFLSLGAINTFEHCVYNLTPERVVESTESFGDYIEDVYCVNKMMEDVGYHRLLSDIPTRKTRLVFEAFANESISDLMNQLTTETVDHVDLYYTNPRNAVNNIFDDIVESKLYSEEYIQKKTFNYQYKKAAYDSISNILLFEYHMCDDPNLPVNCDLFKEGMSIQEAVIDIGRKCDDINSELGIMTESEDDDDDDFDEFEKDLNKDREGETDTSKKDKAPAPKSVANRIQDKAMDAEAKQMKKMAEMRRTGHGVRGAIKAVTNLPNNVLNSIKSFATNKDLKDAQKRKDQMKAPGYKNKIFRNLKLALLYGTVAEIKLALVPVTMFFRHFSKQRDRRLRNELISELDTEIKICDEKINDANGAGDNKEKYKLMRIKAELERERLRVRTNSKYI